MYTFTYKDYLNYLKHKDEIEELKRKLDEKYKKKTNNDSSKCNIIKEDTEKYISGNKTPKENYKNVIFVNNEHDKILRKSLDNKNEVAKFLNKTLNLKKKIEANNLEKYNSSFVAKDLRNQESDVIYKIKDKDVFFLIEHQTKIDYSMAFRILEYQISIIKSSINFKQVKRKGYKYPTIISIVLHTGGEKWNGETNFQDIQEILEGYGNMGIGRYILVDVNDFSEEELLEEDTFLSKVMLIEKTRNTENLGIYLQKIVEKMNNRKDIYTVEQRELLSTIIEMILRKKIGNDLSVKLIKELNKKEDEDMLAVLEMIDRENAMIEARGVRKGTRLGARKKQIEIAKKMLKKNMPINEIAEITGLKEKEINNM